MVPPEDTPLAGLIRAEIRATGPMTAARYMELCLGHPQHGYYVTRDPLGADADFITAPEISQMFGEMIGIWAAWMAQQLPGFRLIELGPGRGTLMADALRVVRGAGLAPEVWFVETSPVLRRIQADAVPGARWADSLDAVPEGPFILLANEFLDALPVHQYLRSAEGWRERLVGLWNGRLDWGLSEPLPGTDKAPVGAWYERSAATEAVLAGIARRLKGVPGAALLIDYGYTRQDRPPGLTLQAVRGHRPVDVLDAPGLCDLTWLVDFDAALEAMRADMPGPGPLITSQRDFLVAMGIGPRAEALATARPDGAGDIADALERLTGADEMGTLFKVLGAVSPGLPAPPGFVPTAAETDTGAETC